MGRASVWLITPKPGSSPFLSVTESERESRCRPSCPSGLLTNDLFTYFPPHLGEVPELTLTPKEQGVFGDKEAAGAWL